MTSPSATARATAGAGGAQATSGASTGGPLPVSRSGPAQPTGAAEIRPGAGAEAVSAAPTSGVTKPLDPTATARDRPVDHRRASASSSGFPLLIRRSSERGGAQGAVLAEARVATPVVRQSMHVRPSGSFVERPGGRARRRSADADTLAERLAEGSAGARLVVDAEDHLQDSRVAPTIIVPRMFTPAVPSCSRTSARPPGRSSTSTRTGLPSM